MNLVRAFSSSVTNHPEKPALFWGEDEYSYGLLWSQSIWVAGELQSRFGVQAGDRVGLWLKNCPEFVPAFFGILHAGAVVVPINNFLKTAEVNYILADAEIDVLITDAELATHHRALEAVRPQLKMFKVEPISRPEPSDRGGLRESAHPPAASSVRASESAPRHLAAHPSGAQRHSASRLPHSKESDLAVIIYTSGTTGHPKGAMLSHGNLLDNVESCRIVLRTVEADRFVVLLPMFHSYMLTVGMLLPLLVGGSLVVIKSLHPVRNVMVEIMQRQATVLPAIPQFYRSLVHAPIHDLHPVRLCISGAAPLPAQVLREFEAKFHIPLIEGYGLSEASPVVTKNPLNGTRKPGSIGLPIPNVEVSIQDAAGHQLGSKEIGEVCVRGGNVMLGYWKQPEETARTLRQGWLLTGDIGYRDEEGYYYITDRKKDMLLVNGINVYPREIEEVLYQFPGVKEAAVVGKPDSRKGEKPVAFVAANDGAVLDQKAMHHFLRRHLADYKVPRQIVVVPALPRNSTGKILKTVLRELPVEEECGKAAETQASSDTQMPPSPPRVHTIASGGAVPGQIGAF